VFGLEIEFDGVKKKRKKKMEGEIV